VSRARVGLRGERIRRDDGPVGRWRRWWVARLPRKEHWQLGQRNIYILPTRAGLVFALTLVLMLVAAINYQLNLGYVLTFLLAGCGIVSMQLTHATLRGLRLRMRTPAPAFAGEAAPLEVVLDNTGRARHGIAVRWLQPHDDAGTAWCDVPSGGSAEARLAHVAARRGWHEVPAVVVETRFPLGLFRAWSIWRPAGRILAWPRPEQHPPPLPAPAPSTGTQPARRTGGGELDGVRPWRRGDTLRQVAWKKVARSGEMISRETTGSAGGDLWLEWSDSAAPGADAEHRLSRLAAWVLQADRSGLRYGLRLPGSECPPGDGDAQRRATLDALAQWP